MTRMVQKSIIIFCLIKVCLATVELKDSCDCCCAIDHLCNDVVVKLKCQKTCVSKLEPFDELKINITKVPSSKSPENKKTTKNDIGDILRASGSKFYYTAESFANGTLKACNIDGKAHLNGEEFQFTKCKMCHCFGEHLASQSSCRDIPNCTE